MERLLITKNGALYSSTIVGASANSLTSQADLDVLQPGGIVWFEKGGTRGTAAGSYTKTDTKGVLALGLPTGFDTRVSPLINTATLAYNKNVAVVAVAGVQVMAKDGVVTLTTGAFTTAMIGTQYVATASSGSGDFRAGATALLRTVSTGVALAADTDLVAGAAYEVIAAGTPDAWDSGTLATNLSGDTLTVGTKAVGAEYGVTVVDLEKEEYERRMWDVTLTLTSASTTDAAMLAALVTAFNAHEKASLIATAAVATGNVGIIFTSVTAGADFTILPQGLLYGNTVTADDTGASIVPTKAEGSNTQIVELERLMNPIEGKTSTYQTNDLGEVWKVPSLVESGLTYVVYVLTWTDQREVAYVSNGSNPSHKTINLAVPTADTTMITAMDNLLADLIA